MIRKENCPVCDSTRTSVFLVRDDVPIRQNTVVSDQKMALNVPRGNLNLAVCQNCGFVFNSTFDSSLVIYGQNYDNAQFFSDMFNDYLSDLVNYLVNSRGVQNCRIVEVGCGDGYFLKRLVEKGNNIGIGYDPSYVGPPEIMDGRIRFEKSYYGAEQSNVPADVVICRHVIEHVPEPSDLLNSIYHALSDSPSAYVFFETPTVEWILRNRTFWDFFYEHCSLFTAQSLTTAFQKAGFKVDKVQTAFGNQYLWLEAGLASKKADEIDCASGSIPVLAAEFSILERDLKNDWQGKIEALSKNGGVAIWGAGAKGMTFANLIDSKKQYISCIVDVNPRKQGHFLSGTGHPIVDYRELFNYNVRYIILMNPNYREEVLDAIKKQGLNIQLLDMTDSMEKNI